MKKPHKVGSCIVYQHVNSYDMDVPLDADTHKLDISKRFQLIMLTGMCEGLYDCGPKLL